MILPKVHMGKRPGISVYRVVMIAFLERVLLEASAFEGSAWYRSVRHGCKIPVPNDLKQYDQLSRFPVMLLA